MTRQKKKYFIISGIGIVLLIASYAFKNWEALSNFLFGGAAYFLLWGMFADILSGVTIVKSVKGDRTVINTRNVNVVRPEAEKNE